MTDAKYLSWRKSSYSSYTGNCVEVATAVGSVGVRDSKQRGLGPVIEFTRSDWAAFIAAAKAGELGR